MNANCAQCRYFARHVFPGMLEHYSGFCRKPMERPPELSGTFWPMVKAEDACCQYQDKPLNAAPSSSETVTEITVISKPVTKGIRRFPSARMGSGTFQPVS